MPPSPSPSAEFARLALPWLEDVSRFARSLTRDAADADDLVQETYLRAWRGWHTFDPVGDARRWLFTICRNAFVKQRRARGALVESAAADVDALPAVMLHATLRTEGLGDLLEHDEVCAAVRAAVDALPEPHHSVLVLVDLEELSYEEAAAVLGVPVGTVRSGLYRARRLVQERLRAHAMDLGLAAAARDAASLRPEQRP